MNCLLYRLRFDTPVHFGSPDSALSLYSSEDHFRADTLFSALCHTALGLYGPDGLQQLIRLVQTDGLRLSDAMPWSGKTYFLPKPCAAAQTDRELPAGKRKAMKKLAWIPVDRFAEYCNALRTGELFECESVSFGHSTEVTKAMVPAEGDALPYPVGLYHFRNDCGLYFLASCTNAEDEPWLSELVEALGLTGIGGKISAGYGKFTVITVTDLSTSTDATMQALYRGLMDTARYRMLLTTALPSDDELDTVMDGASYQLVRRGGFVASDTYAASPRKKQTQYFCAAGAVFAHPFAGALYEIGTQGTHPVYRYARPMFLGVEL